jgi:uncharacterized RDD family membrane protein YckC
MLKNTQNSDPLHRPQKRISKDALPLASDVLVASAARRLAAFIVDGCVILTLAMAFAFPLLTRVFPPFDTAEALRLVTFALFGVWGTYVVVLNASPVRATLGQWVFGMQVCTLFGGTLSPIAAMGRFVVCTAPLMCLLVVGTAEIIALLPEAWRTGHFITVKHSTDNEMLYTLLMVPALVQFILIWPLLTSNYTRVLWDRMFHACVLLRSIRSR